MTTTHLYQVYLRATPDVVWQAITDPAFTRLYFFGSEIQTPLRDGGPIRYLHGDGSPTMAGTIEVFEPPARLVHSWRSLYDAALAQEPPSRVEWIVEPVGEGLTRLRVIHSDLALSPGTWSSVKDGWAYVLDGLKSVIETGSGLPPITQIPPSPDGPDAAASPDTQWHRTQAIEANNDCWELLETDQRTPEADEDLLQRAFASAYHWRRASGHTAANDVRADYMLARAHHAIGLGERALHYAQRCLAGCRRHGLADFDLAYAYEAQARALQLLGNGGGAQEALAAARAVSIADPEDAAVLAVDLAKPL